tara:strand:- start:1286 stop:2473 length:1188 start_codon:yes stop_codon:yes gene_type:complete
MPTSSGWFVWAVPFLIFYQGISGRRSIIIITIFSACFALNILINHFKIINTFISSSFNQLYSIDFSSIVISSAVNTLIFLLGIILITRMWREAVNENDFFRKSRKPFVIGIAGDSGSGKDTLSHAISGVFGNHSITTISGDDYHIWDRHKPMWQVMTHLNPMANNLEAFNRDLLKLTDRKSINARTYNHETGKMSKHIKVASNDFIIASGLHALYLPQLRSLYNLKIFLDIDEDLRRSFKIERDVKERGHDLDKVIKSIESRRDDFKKFIYPQKKYAYLILSLQPINLLETTKDDNNKYKVVVTIFNGLGELQLNRVLVGLCGLHVDMEVDTDSSKTKITIEGDAVKEDIAQAAKILCPDLLDFFDLNPRWYDGSLGIMQIITIYYMNQIFVGRS